jgi:ribosome biogenesis GTPase
MKGTVYKSTGSWYSVKDESGRFWNARIKGVMKLDNITSTNPVAVGDTVSFDLEDEGERRVMITEIDDRHNYINRQSPRIKSQQHIVAANLSQSLLIATIREPRTSQGFIDRFLVACEMYHIPAIILFNKMDLYRQKEMDQFQRLREVYEAVGYQVLGLSLKGQRAGGEIFDLLQDRTTLISGHSGVGKGKAGKGCFLNRLIPRCFSP